MRHLRKAVCILVMTIFSYCSIQCSYNVGFIGHWQRTIDDGEFLGEEFLSIRDDGSVKMGSKLKCRGNEDGFSYNICFETSIEGLWEQCGNDIIIHLNLGTFTFKVLPKSFHVYMSDRDNEEYKGEYLKEMEQALVNELKSQFVSFFSEYSNRTFDLKDVSLTNDVLHCSSDVAEMNFYRTK